MIAGRAEPAKGYASEKENHDNAKEKETLISRFAKVVRSELPSVY